MSIQEENEMKLFSYYWDLHIETVKKMQNNLTNGYGDELSSLIKSDRILLRKCRECIGSRG